MLKYAVHQELTIYVLIRVTKSSMPLQRVAMFHQQEIFQQQFGAIQTELFQALEVLFQVSGLTRHENLQEKNLIQIR